MEDNLFFVKDYIIQYVDKNINEFSKGMKIHFNYLKSRNLKYIKEIVVCDKYYIIHINELSTSLEFRPDKDFIRYIRKMKLKMLKNEIK